MDMSNFNEKFSDCEMAMDCTIPMGITSENVAERFGVSREAQDKMSVESHTKLVVIFAKLVYTCS